MKGNQLISVPWMPNQKLRYKSLSLEQKLRGEVAAGAIGELAKDVLLHPIDTLKSRKQAVSKDDDDEGLENEGENGSSEEGVLRRLRNLYAGFPAVATSSLPQGGVFFLAKKGGFELLKSFSPSFAASLVGQAIPVGLGSIGYWAVRTPAEIVKVNVQLGKSSSVRNAFVDVRSQVTESGLPSLWKFYPSLLSLDIPYAIINFALYGIFNDMIASYGIEANVYTRLLSGVACGMIAAGITCPIDVAKTRIISRARSGEDDFVNATRIQGDGHDKPGLISHKDSLENRQNVVLEMANILQNEGLRIAFYWSQGARLIRWTFQRRTSRRLFHEPNGSHDAFV